MPEIDYKQFHPCVPNKKTNNLIGQRFNKLTVLSIFCRTHYPSGATALKWLCLCGCGRLTVVTTNALVRGTTKACGCVHRRHGEYAGRSPSPELGTFKDAKRRCQKSYRREYPHYGGRGIEFRFESFKQFLDEIGRRPSPKHTLERKDNNGHYEPGNVKWATWNEQAHNKRNNLQITWRGKTHILSDWSKRLEIKYTTLHMRLYVYKWDVDKAFTLPVRGRL